MRVLTREEVLRFVYRDKKYANGRPAKECIQRLEDFQRTLISKHHTAAIDALIPAAVALTKKDKTEFRREYKMHMSSEKESKVFHYHMNELAREAGLRR